MYGPDCQPSGEAEQDCAGTRSVQAGPVGQAAAMWAPEVLTIRSHNNYDYDGEEKIKKEKLWGREAQYKNLNLSKNRNKFVFLERESHMDINFLLMFPRKIQENEPSKDGKRGESPGASFWSTETVRSAAIPPFAFNMHVYVVEPK